MKRTLAIIDDMYEDLELWYPKLRLEESGGQVVVAAPRAGHVYTGKHGYPCTSDAAIADMRESDFDALLVPGGFAPDKLRRDPKVLQLVRDFEAAGKPIAHICHAGWILISAGVLRGRRTTSTVGIRDDMVNAGGFGWMNPSWWTATRSPPARRKIWPSSPRRWWISSAERRRAAAPHNGGRCPRDRRGVQRWRERRCPCVNEEPDPRSGE